MWGRLEKRSSKAMVPDAIADFRRRPRYPNCPFEERSIGFPSGLFTEVAESKAVQATSATMLHFQRRRCRVSEVSSWALAGKVNAAKSDASRKHVMARIEKFLLRNSSASGMRT